MYLELSRIFLISCNLKDKNLHTGFMFLEIATCCPSNLWQSMEKEEQKLKPTDVNSVDRHSINKPT